MEYYRIVREHETRPQPLPAKRILRPSAEFFGAQLSQVTFWYYRNVEKVHKRTKK